MMSLEDFENKILSEDLLKTRPLAGVQYFLMLPFVIVAGLVGGRTWNASIKPHREGFCTVGLQRLSEMGLTERKET